MRLQVNLEFLVADKRTFLTDKEMALQTLFGEANDIQETFNAEIMSIADRVATAFASLKVGSCQEFCDFTSSLQQRPFICGSISRL